MYWLLPIHPRTKSHSGLTNQRVYLLDICKSMFSKNVCDNNKIFIYFNMFIYLFIYFNVYLFIYCNMFIYFNVYLFILICLFIYCT